MHGVSCPVYAKRSHTMSCMSTSRGPGRLSFSVEVSLCYSSPMETSDGPSAAAPSGLRSMLQSSELRLLSYNPTVCDRTTLDSIPFFSFKGFYISLLGRSREHHNTVHCPFVLRRLKERNLALFRLMSRGAGSPSSTGAEPFCTDTFNKFRYFFRESEHRGSRERRVDLALQFLTRSVEQPAVR